MEFEEVALETLTQKLRLEVRRNESHEWVLIRRKAPSMAIKQSGLGRASTFGNKIRKNDNRIVRMCNGSLLSLAASSQRIVNLIYTHQPSTEVNLLLELRIALL